MSRSFAEPSIIAVEESTSETTSTWGQALADLQKLFGAPFSVFHAETGAQLQRPADHARIEWGGLVEVGRAVARRGEPGIIEEEGPLVVLAIPLQLPDEAVVACGVFASRSLLPAEDVARSADFLGRSAEEAVAWIDRQTFWSPEALLRMSDMYLAKLAAEQQLNHLQGEVENLSLHLSLTYEEISLLYRLTQNLTLSSKDEDLARLALDWLVEVVPADGLAIQFVPLAEPSTVTRDARTAPSLLSQGNCPVDCDEFTRLVRHLQIEGTGRSLVVNRTLTSDAAWQFPSIRELIIVPLYEGNNLFGWLAAFNHTRNEEFGSVEASLLNSVGAILGIHSGNIELYRQQGEFLASVVRALTSAIDAKDPYTCGHSDRVARVAVRIAEELGFTSEQLNTLYLSGLLHDIGKIGIDDNVLRKPGKLTPAEYEHIKSHAEIGYRILIDLKQLGDVLPVVLHHHEQWNGDGYPHRLAGDGIPFMARVVAVADAFDAMGSDRPYRPGMPDEKMDEILRQGRGKQWDPQVVDAFFRAREDIRQICAREEKASAVEQWI